MLREILADAPGVSSNGDLRDIIITGIAAIIAASIPAAFSLREKEPKELQRLRRLDEDYHKQLIADKVTAEHGEATAEDELRTANQTIDRLRQFISSLGYDPYKLTKNKRSHNGE